MKETNKKLIEKVMTRVNWLIKKLNENDWYEMVSSKS